MTFAFDSVSLALPVFVQGLFLSLGPIVALARKKRSHSARGWTG